MPLPSLHGVDDDAKNLAVFLQEVLDRVIATYESYGMPLPGRRYWTMSAPVVDCEQLVVSLIQMYIGAPGDEATEPRRCNDPRSATMTVEVARAVPIGQQNGQPPRADEIQEAAEVQAYDSWILLRSVNDLDAWSQGMGTFGLGVIATVDTTTPQGGFQTVRMTITMAVP
jgi:hypothetical protein